MSLKKSNVCIFFTQSGKIYTDMSVVSVTNMRYVWNIKIGRMKFYCNWILLLLEAWWLVFDLEYVLMSVWVFQNVTMEFAFNFPWLVHFTNWIIFDQWLTVSSSFKITLPSFFNFFLCQIFYPNTCTFLIYLFSQWVFLISVCLCNIPAKSTKLGINWWILLIKYLDDKKIIQCNVIILISKF